MMIRCMFSPGPVALFLVVMILTASRTATAAADREAPAHDGPTVFLGLRKEYLRICKTTKRDSPEYRTAIERALVVHRERGGTDDYEITLRRQLGHSYRVAKEYAKSTEILTATLGEGNDPDAKAYDMLVIARNSRDVEDVATARRFLEESAARYPETGAGQTAMLELDRPLYRTEMPEDGVPLWRGIGIGSNLALIAVLVAILVRRQIIKSAS